MQATIKILGSVVVCLGLADIAGADVTRLGPIVPPAQAPAVCQIVGILPDSPAKSFGLLLGDRIQTVNGTKPADASAVADLIEKSDPEATIDVIGSSNSVRHLHVTLNKQRPRLGAICDLSGWHKNSVSAAGNEAITLFSGPYALTASGVLDKGLAFLRVRITNYGAQDLKVSPAIFSIQDGTQKPMQILSPSEVMYFMHGEDGVPYLKPPPGHDIKDVVTLDVPADSIVRMATPPHKKRKDWSAKDESYIKANAEYMSKESLWPTTVAPGGMVDGLIYILAPTNLPLTLEAHVEGNVFAADFGIPKPAGDQMTEGELIKFFTAQKKGTPVKLTLRKGKVFVGKFASYDADNEIVWFDTPSGILLNTSSFGIRHIQSAQTITPDSDKKPAVDPVN